MDTPTDVFNDADDELSTLPAQTIDDSEDNDDPKDLDYVPPHHTPNHRNYKEEPRDRHLPIRAKAAAKHPGTCAFTGERNVCATVQYAHGTARNNGYKRPKMMLNLEYHWGFPTPYTLSLDTRNNIFPANPTAHVGYDNDGYGVLPQLDDLQTIFDDTVKTPTLPVNDRQKYDDLWPYPADAPHFVYDPVMFRFKEDTAPPITYRDPVADANGDRPTTHHYCPYPNHQLTLRLHPVFAIVDLYIKGTGPPSEDFLKLRPIGAVAIPGQLSGETNNNNENSEEFDTPTRRPGGKGKGKAVADEAQPAVEGSSNAQASTSGAVPGDEDGEAPAVAKGGRKQAPSKPAGAGTAQASKRRRKGDDGDDDDDEEAQRDKKRSKANGKGKQKASKPEQAGEVAIAEAGPSKTKRSKKKAAR